MSGVCSRLEKERIERMDRPVHALACLPLPFRLPQQATLNISPPPVDIASLASFLPVCVKVCAWLPAEGAQRQGPGAGG